MPETRDIELSMIDEPDLAMRAEMDDTKLAELCESLATVGLIHPLCVWEREGRYVIEDGHRRFNAANMLGWRTIRCEIYAPAELATGAVMVAANRYREDPSAAEEALLFQKHRELYNLDEAALCARFKVSPDYLGDRFRLLRGDSHIFDAVLKRGISFAVARELNKCEDEAHRRYLLDIALRTGYSSRVMADQVRQWRANAQPLAPVPAASAGEPSAEPAPEYKQECKFCGGYRDPWNLVPIMVHKAELDMIMKQLEATAKDVG